MLYSMIAVAASLLVVLLVLEAAFRIAGIDPRPPRLRDVEIRRDDGSWERVSVWGTSPLKRDSPFREVAMGEFVPDVDFRFIYYDRTAAGADEEWVTSIVTGRINRYGLRGPEIEPDKPDGVFRVLVLGDSFTFGAGVADDESFPAQLQPLLAGSCATPRRFEVINAGVSGYNTADEVVNLERRWLPELEPDLVLLTFYVNDAYDDTRMAAAMRGGALSGSGSAWFWRSRFLGWLASRITAWKTARDTEALYRAQFSDDPELAGHNWQASRAALGRAAAVTRERGVPLAIVIFPDLHGLDDVYPFEFVHREVTSAADESAVPVLDLLETFRGRDPRSLWVHPTDHHPNAEAHARAAEALNRWVCQLADDAIDG